MNKDNNPIIFFAPLANLILSGGLLGGLIYFCGRQYLEGYYYGLNVPITLLQFDFPSCVYSCVCSWTILFPVIEGLIAYNIIKLLYTYGTGKKWIGFSLSTSIQDTFVQIPNFSKPHSILKNSYWILVSIYILLLLLLLYTLTFPTTNNLRNLLQLPVLLGALLYAFIITDERKIPYLFEQHRKNQSKLKQIIAILFLISQFFVLWLSYSIPYTWGQVKGINDFASTDNISSSKLPVVEMNIIRPIYKYPQINWESINGSVYKNADPLIIIQKTDIGLIVKKQVIKDETIIIHMDDISSITMIK